MSDDSWSWSKLSSENSSKMESFHSSQTQCCCCVVAVLVSLGGVIMTSIGVCFILNYDMININIDILPLELQTEEGKKIIGIILICFGITGVIISSLVSILFFTICHAPQSPQTISPMFYDNRTKDNSMYYVDRPVTPGVMASRTIRSPSPSASMPRKGYNTTKKKINPPILESVKEDPVQPYPNPLPILQINGANCDGSLLPMKDIHLDSINSQNTTPTWGNGHLQTGAMPSMDIATIQVTHMERKDSKINSSKL